MESLKAKKREKFGRKTKALRKKGILPAVLYGEGIKNLALEVDREEFAQVYQEAGESSLIALEIEAGHCRKLQVLIHDTSHDPLTGEILHVDFYRPSTKKKVEAEVPLVFTGEPPAVKELGGTLVKEIQQVQVKGLVQKLPREIEVNVKKLQSFEDRIQIKDLAVPEGVEIMRDQEDIVALVVPPEKEEEEKPAEEERPTEEGEAEEDKAKQSQAEETKDKGQKKEKT